MQVIGYRGLALGTSIAALFNAATLLFLLRAHLNGLNGARLFSSMSRIAVASAVMGAVAYTADRALGSWMPGSAEVLQIVRLAIVIGVALAALAGAAWLLRSEFNQFALVTRRLRRSTR